MTPNGCAAAITAASRTNCVAMVTTIVVIGKMKTAVQIVSWKESAIQVTSGHAYTWVFQRIPIFSSWTLGAFCDFH